MEAAARGHGSAEEVLATADLLPAEAEAPLDKSLCWETVAQSRAVMQILNI
jgi:hypothetical protein